MPFLKFNFVKSYARVVLLSTSVLVFLLSPSAQSTEYIRAITRNGVFTFENPVGSDGKAASVIVRGGGNEGLFIVTGEAADLLAGRQRTPVVRPKLSPLVFENLNFIINSKQNRVAAFYPLRPTASIELTALHTLKGNTLEKPLSDQRKLWGVLNPKTNKLMDIAIVADSGTSLEGLLAEIKIAIDSPKPMTDGYVEHLNEVDSAGELMLTPSSVKIISRNENYVFFKNDQNSLVGSASSGAVIYSEDENLAHSIVLCSSNVYVNEKYSATIIRALRLDSILKLQLIELQPADIENFEKLPGECHNGRGGGGA